MVLIPVALDLTHGGVRVVDHFCWGAGADEQAVAEFSRAYCRESSLPDGLYSVVKDFILEQASSLQEAQKSCSTATRADTGERLEKLRSVPGRELSIGHWLQAYDFGVALAA